MDDAIAFAEKVLALLQHGKFTATYKYAVLIGLVDLSLEGYTAAGTPPEMVTTRQLAEVVTRLYWPQVAPFDGALLRQNTRNEAKIIRRVVETRDRVGGMSIARAKQRARDDYDRLVRAVEWKLVEDPLPRLQEFGGHQDRFIYDIAWRTKQLTRGAFQAADFDNSIRFRPGVAGHLVRLDGLLRPLLHREWAMQVARINQLPAARLADHLFGVDRAALGPVMPGLRELQQDRCFYCAERLAAASAVDHFLPWSRISLDAIENLVVAHDRCNNAKTDHLAADLHLERWCARLDKHGNELAQIASDVQWEASARRALGVARALYLPLPATARVWSRHDGLVPATPARFRELLVTG